MIFPNFDPALFTIPQFHLASLTIGPLLIRWYALAYIAGLVLGWAYARALVQRKAFWGGAAPFVFPPREEAARKKPPLSRGFDVEARTGFEPVPPP